MPHPPSQWLRKLSASLQEQNPDLEKQQADLVAAGTYVNLPERKKRDVTETLEGKAIDRLGDDEDYWDGVIDAATNPSGSGKGPNLPDESATVMSYGTAAGMQALKFRNFCKKNGLDANSALAAIDAISDAFEDTEKEHIKQEAKLREAPIDDAMQLQSAKSPYVTDDENPAKEQGRNEAEWGREYKEGKRGRVRPHIN